MEHQFRGYPHNGRWINKASWRRRMGCTLLGHVNSFAHPQQEASECPRCLWIVDRKGKKVARLEWRRVAGEEA